MNHKETTKFYNKLNHATVANDYQINVVERGASLFDALTTAPDSLIDKYRQCGYITQSDADSIKHYNKHNPVESFTNEGDLWDFVSEDTNTNLDNSVF